MEQGFQGQWSIILKISGVKRKRKKRAAFADEARNRQSTVVFYGCSSSAANLIPVLFCLKALEKQL